MLEKSIAAASRTKLSSRAAVSRRTSSYRCCTCGGNKGAPHQVIMLGTGNCTQGHTHGGQQYGQEHRMQQHLEVGQHALAGVVQQKDGGQHGLCGAGARQGSREERGWQARGDCARHVPGHLAAALYALFL